MELLELSGCDPMLVEAGSEAAGATIESVVSGLRALRDRRAEQQRDGGARTQAISQQQLVQWAEQVLFLGKHLYVPVPSNANDPT